MNKKGQLGVGGIVMLFVGIVFGIAMLTPIFEIQSTMTDKQTATNQTVDVTDAYTSATEVDETINFTAYEQSDWKQSECPLSSATIRNGAGTELVEDTDYTLYDSKGEFSLLNTTKTIPETSLNTTYVDYTYCADGYNTDSSSRSVARLIGLFAAFALLGFVLSKLGVWDFFNR